MGREGESGWKEMGSCCLPSAGIRSFFGQPDKLQTHKLQTCLAPRLVIYSSPEIYNVSYMYTYNLTRLQRRLKPILNCLLKAKPMRQFQTVTTEFHTNKKQENNRGKSCGKTTHPGHVSKCLFFQQLSVGYGTEEYVRHYSCV